MEQLLLQLDGDDDDHHETRFDLDADDDDDDAQFVDGGGGIILDRIAAMEKRHLPASDVVDLVTTNDSSGGNRRTTAGCLRPEMPLSELIDIRMLQVPPGGATTP